MATGQLQRTAVDRETTDRARSKGRVEQTPSDQDARVAGDLLHRVHRLARRQRNLLDRLSRAEELADSLALEVSELETALLRVVRVAVPDEPKSRVVRSHSQADRLLRDTAAAGIQELELEPKADGSVRVRVDGGKAFTLPPTLGDLLGVLAVDSGITADELIGWKTLDEVAVLLSRNTGRVMSRHAVSQNVYRLRKALFERGGVNPYLIQTSRRHGLRFALRQRKDVSASPAAERWGTR